MGKLPKQTKRADLVKRLRELGFDGPFVGSGPHPEFMIRDGRVLKIPNSHRGDIREPLLRRIIQQAGLTPEEWAG